MTAAPLRPWRRAEQTRWKCDLACGHVFSVESSYHPGTVPRAHCETCGQLVDIDRVRRT